MFNYRNSCGCKYDVVYFVVCNVVVIKFKFVKLRVNVYEYYDEYYRLNMWEYGVF